MVSKVARKCVLLQTNAVVRRMVTTAEKAFLGVVFECLLGVKQMGSFALGDFDADGGASAALLGGARAAIQYPYAYELFEAYKRAVLVMVEGAVSAARN